jgi:hypothetical protein
LLRGRPIPNGATVDIVGYDKKNKTAEVFYKNLYGWVDQKLIQEQKP